MSKTLKRIAQLLNLGLTFVLVSVVLFALAISSLVVIILSPLIAFVGANGYKMAHTTTANWWEIYKARLVDTCTDDLPIVVYVKNF